MLPVTLISLAPAAAVDSVYWEGRIGLGLLPHFMMWKTIKRPGANIAALATAWAIIAGSSYDDSPY
jgi:hypothetical protein